MKRRTVEVDHWRHFVPLAPDIDLTVESGTVTYHDLDPDVIIQGARDIHTSESPSIDLSVTPFQRGRRLIFVPITHPLQGHVDSTVNGFRYSVHPQFNGEDCFNYILTNGTQESNVARVKVSVMQGYRYDLDLRHEYNDVYTFEIKELLPTELQQPKYQLFTWYWTRPVLEHNAKLDRMQVVFKKTLLTMYKLSGYRDEAGRYMYTVYSNPTKFKHSFPDDSACHDFPIGDSDKLYKATGDRGYIEIEALYYFGELMRSDSRVVTLNPESLYGRRWWESGNIQD